MIRGGLLSILQEQRLVDYWYETKFSDVQLSEQTHFLHNESFKFQTIHLSLLQIESMLDQEYLSGIHIICYTIEISHAPKFRNVHIQNVGSPTWSINYRIVYKQVCKFPLTPSLTWPPIYSIESAANIGVLTWWTIKYSCLPFLSILFSNTLVLCNPCCRSFPSFPTGSIELLGLSTQVTYAAAPNDDILTSETSMMRSAGKVANKTAKLERTESYPTWHELSGC